LSDNLIKIIIALVLLLHGLGHGGALVALVWIRLRPGTNTGRWREARSWLFPSLPGSAATVVASTFWILSLVGFVLAAMSFWGVLVPGDIWRQAAIYSAVISAVGIILFFGIWPSFNMLAALAVNIAVMVTQIWLHWPPQAMFGN
jgi:hypothetical protein